MKKPSDDWTEMQEIKKIVLGVCLCVVVFSKTSSGILYDFAIVMIEVIIH